MQRKNFLSAIFVGLLTIFLIVPSVSRAADGTGELIIFHTNDMHCRIINTDDDGKSIGLAEISAAVKAVKKKNPDTLWFDAGDTFHGMPRININKGENLAPLLNLAGVDGFAPGNHDFNYGSDQLEKLAKKLKFPILSANVVRRDTSERVFTPSKIFNLPNGIRVGVFGMTTPETFYSTASKNVASINFLNPVETAREMVEELRPKCDVLICVMHMGVNQSSEFTSERIAEEVGGIDLIVDGHSHTELHEGLTVGDTLIVQTGCYEHYLGQAKISLEDHKIISKQAKLLSAADVKKIAPKTDSRVLKSVLNVERSSQKYFSQVVAHSDRALTSSRFIVRREESELGNLVADAFKWKANADIAICNGGGLRADLPAGAVTRGDILAIFPFGNKLVKLEIDGKNIRAMLEHSVFAYPEAFGGFMDVSGITFTFNPDKLVGHRVENIFINGAPLDENKIYTLATTDFTASGGDGYEMLKDLKRLEEFDGADEVLGEYLNKVGMKNIELGRIKNLHELPLPSEYSSEEVKKAA